VRVNRAGVDPALLPELADLDGFDIARFLGRLAPAALMAARHTVGLADVITGHPNQVHDGLPESLEEVVTRYHHTYFKLKVGGDVNADIQRLSEIAAVLDRVAEPILISLDGNEQYENADAVGELWRNMTETPALKARPRTRKGRLDSVVDPARDH
jgi:L-alanine-DL-glutamate epimerase-like enolase superfamily enzyme